jgi:hypothetical protein
MGLVDGYVKPNDEGERKGYGLCIDDFYFKASLETDFGLSFWVSPRMFLKTVDFGKNGSAGYNFENKTQLTHLRLDASYALEEPGISFGVEAAVPLYSIDINGKTWSGMKLEGLELEPHVEAKFGAIGVWCKLNIAGLGSKTTDDDGTEISATPVLTPYIGVSYSF